MTRFLAVAGLLLLAGSLPAQPSYESDRIQLVLTPAKPPTPALRFTLLPELREQTPGNAALFYRKAGKLIDRIAAEPPGRGNLMDLLTRWEQQARAGPSQDELRKLVERFREPLDLLREAARCETCDFEMAQRLRDKGYLADLPEIQQLDLGTRLLNFKARLELLEDRPEVALRTLQAVYSVSRHASVAPHLYFSQTGVANLSRANQTLQRLLCHPRTPNLGASLLALPHPLVDLREALEGTRLAVLGTFPGLLEVRNNPDAGPLSSEQIEPVVAQLARMRFIRPFFPFLVPPPVMILAGRVELGTNVLKKHEAARKALIAAGRSAETIDRWPHLQVALMHSLLEFDQQLDEMIQLQALPYWQAAEPLAALAKKRRELNRRGPDAPAIALAPRTLPDGQFTILPRAQADRELAALCLIEAVRLYAANHQGKLPRTLADIKEIPLPICPLTGKSFEYRLEGNQALLSSPPFPGRPELGVQPLDYAITLKSQDQR